MAALNIAQILQGCIELKRLLQLQRKPELCVQLQKRATEHRVNLAAQVLDLSENIPQAIERGRVRFLGAKLDARLFRGGTELSQLMLQGTRTKHLEPVPHHFHVHGSKCVYSRSTASELRLLVFNSTAHLTDDHRVLALQPLQFLNLLRQISPSNGDGSGCLGAQLSDTTNHSALEDLLPLPQ
jgi:hypothetical protein